MAVPTTLAAPAALTGQQPRWQGAAPASARALSMIERIVRAQRPQFGLQPRQL
jgi:hypothetical protein